MTAARAKLLGQLAAVALVASLLALLAWKLRDGGSKVPAQVASGQTVRAPSFTLPRLGRDGSISLASLRGKAVIVNFWASWCRPCADEAPALQRAWERHRDDGLVLVGVDYDDVHGDALAFARKHGLTYPLVYDKDKRVVLEYGLSGVPETFFIDRRGHIVGRIAGPVDDEEVAQQFDAYVRRILT